jgi:hypothetical protein
MCTGHVKLAAAERIVHVFPHKILLTKYFQGVVFRALYRLSHSGYPAQGPVQGNNIVSAG